MKCHVILSAKFTYKIKAHLENVDEYVETVGTVQLNHHVLVPELLHTICKRKLKTTIEIVFIQYVSTDNMWPI